MKKSKLLPLAGMMLGFGVTALTGCDTYEQYIIDSPDDLQEKIDSIYDANNKVEGDTITIPITVPNCGADDNSSTWWTEFSQYFTIPANRLLHLEFYNYGTGENNWNNWNLCVCNGERDGSDYSEYFVLRSDAYGWGNTDYNGAMIHTDYADVLEGDDMWTTFREKMQGAYVYMDIDHSRTGNCYVTATHVATDGTTFVETYEQPVSSTADINAFLVCDASHFTVKTAYTITSKVQAVDDEDAVLLTISGTPEALELGATEEEIWGDAVATVTFADGSTTTADYADLTFTMPDLTTAGTKTVIVSYSKTKLGNYGTPVAAYYNVVLNNAMSGMKVVTMPYVTTYYFYDGVISPVIPDGLELSGVYTDGTEGNVPLSTVTFSSLNPVAGTQDVAVTYDGGSSVTTTTFQVEVKEGTGVVGAMDFLNGWWTTFSDDYVVAAGASHTFKMSVYSDNLGNWHSPCTILRKADLTEYAVLRQDNYGWGDGYGTAILDCDWDWDTFMDNINGSEVTITVTNNGDNTANVDYDVVYANGEVHYQHYTGITVDSADLQTALVTEESCLILHD